MLPLDMAKIGYLYLNEGRWDGEQIIPAAWVAASTRKHISATLQDGYGYQWWVADDGYYMALGYAGQYIFIVPEHELVVVFTGNLSENDFSGPQILLDTFIIPAARSSAPMPTNPDGVELLDSKIRQAALNPADPETVPPLPAIAQRVTGQTYILDPNSLGMHSVSLTFKEEAEALLSWTLSSDEAQLLPADPNYSSHGQSAVGLDNVYRFTPGLYRIPMGLKGWWETEETFVADRDHIGNTGQSRAWFTFEGDQLALQIWENGQPLPKINGRLEE